MTWGTRFARCVVCAALCAGLQASSSLAAQPLRWAPATPPGLEPIRLGSGPTVSRLDPDTDYVLQMPRELKRGGTVIEGGHNVTIIGGRVTIPPGTTSDHERRGVYVKNATGTVHIEGLQVEGAPGTPLDAIAISAPQATVQIQNVRATGVTGTVDGFHADVVQPFGGVKELRIDRLTGFSNYQGLFIMPGSGPIGSATIQDVSLINTVEPTNGGGVMVWLANGCQTYVSPGYAAP